MISSSFVNGIIVGAGIVVALMSVGFLYYIAPVENQAGISSTEIRVAILLGGIVAATAIAYEFYTKKNEEKSTKPISDSLSFETMVSDTTKPEPTKSVLTDSDKNLIDSKDTKES